MNSSDYDTKHIKVLDGIRAIAIMIIVWYHIWQQSWLMPVIGTISFDLIPRYGFLLVDMMILISGFCLFIPYARGMVYKEKMPDAKEFYIKRIARIFPSYFLSMIIALVFIIVLKKGWFNSFFIKDTLTHLTFTYNWFFDTLLHTNYIGVLWTVAIEVQFYLIFPLIAKWFTKKPFLTYLAMLIIGVGATIIIKSNLNGDNSTYFVNNFFTFLPVFANGMLSCLIYIEYTKKAKRSNLKSFVFTSLSILMIIGYIYLVKSIGTSSLQEWQINNRITLSLVFTIFIISTCLAGRIYQKLFNNRLMKFIAIISFNLYIYHQFVAVKLKEFRIPYYYGSIAPNIVGDKKWQWPYAILCLVISIIIATIITYFVEKPMAKYIKKKFTNDEEKK